MGEALWQRLLRPLLFLLPAETAHRLAFGALRLALAPAPLRALVARVLARPDPALRTEAMGLSFASPVGLAAGFDKDAVGFRQLAALGFGFVEVGTVTPMPQPGNPRPRLFRLERDRALLNRMGFNSAGAAAVRARLARPRSPRDGVVGVNLGRNKDSRSAVEDFRAGARSLGAYADYIAVNVSSPNTPGLRDLQAVAELRPILQAVLEEAAGRPVLVKIAPDLSDEDVDAVADLALELGLAGIIATNTTVSRAGLSTAPASVAALGPGGLSGAPLRRRATDVLARLRSRVGDGLVLIAAGGIADADDAWSRIAAGATLLEVYTGFVLGGPGTPSGLARELAARARAEGWRRVQDAVGSAGRQGQKPCK